MAVKFIILASASKEVEWLRNLLFKILLVSKLILPIPIHCDKIEWFRNLLFKILFVSKPILPILIYCNSKATISRAYGKVYNEKSRHIGLRHSYVRQSISDEVITMNFV